MKNLEQAQTEEPHTFDVFVEMNPLLATQKLKPNFNLLPLNPPDNWLNNELTQTLNRQKAQLKLQPSQNSRSNQIGIGITQKPGFLQTNQFFAKNLTPQSKHRFYKADNIESARQSSADTFRQIREDSVKNLADRTFSKLPQILTRTETTTKKLLSQSPNPNKSSPYSYFSKAFTSDQVSEKVKGPKECVLHKNCLLKQKVRESRNGDLQTLTAQQYKNQYFQQKPLEVQVEKQKRDSGKLKIEVLEPLQCFKSQKNLKTALETELLDIKKQSYPFSPQLVETEVQTQPLRLKHQPDSFQQIQSSVEIFEKSTEEKELNQSLERDDSPENGKNQETPVFESSKLASLYGEGLEYSPKSISNASKRKQTRAQFSQNYAEQKCKALNIDPASLKKKEYPQKTVLLNVGEINRDIRMKKPKLLDSQPSFDNFYHKQSPPKLADILRQSGATLNTEINQQAAQTREISPAVGVLTDEKGDKNTSKDSVTDLASFKTRKEKLQAIRSQVCFSRERENSQKQSDLARNKLKILGPKQRKVKPMLLVQNNQTMKSFQFLNQVQSKSRLVIRTIEKN